MPSLLTDSTLRESGDGIVFTFQIHCIRIKSLLFWDGLFLPPKNCYSGQGQWYFNSSNTGVLEKANFSVAASQRGGTSVAEGSPIVRGQKWPCFGHFSRGDPFLCMSIHNKPSGFNDTSESTRQVIRRK